MNRFCECVDCGSANCPCVLAVSGDCSVCGKLQGGECACNWTGVCVYNEFVQSGYRINNPRTEKAVHIREKKKYSHDLEVLVLDVGRGFALSALQPGSFVFLRDEEDPAFFDAPISVMKSGVEKGEIHLAIKKQAIKTKTILENQAGDTLFLRGVFRSGIIGMQKINGAGAYAPRCKRLLVVSKGIGIAPAVLLSQWAKDDIEIDYLVDTEKITEELVEDYLRPYGGDGISYISLGENFSKKYPDLGCELMDKIKQGNYDGVAVFASDYYFDRITAMLEVAKNLYGDRIPKVLAYSNNLKMCCGEGICGACAVTNIDGTVTKLCKCKSLV